MLVIRRRPGETVTIGADVEVEILEVCGNQVKIGVRAPREVLVMRKEVQRIYHENRAAARPAPGSGMETVLKCLRDLPK